MHCGHCGHEVPEGAKRCGHCGQPVKSKPASGVDLSGLGNTASELFKKLGSLLSRLFQAGDPDDPYGKILLIRKIILGLLLLLALFYFLPVASVYDVSISIMSLSKLSPADGGVLQMFSVSLLMTVVITAVCVLMQAYDRERPYLFLTLYSIANIGVPALVLLSVMLNLGQIGSFLFILWMLLSFGICGLLIWVQVLTYQAIHAKKAAGC